MRVQIEPINAKLDQLLEMKLERSITLAEYLGKKEKLVNQKVALDQRMTQIGRKGLDWLEPMKEFLLLNKDAEKVALSGDPVSFRAFLKNIGSNFLLKGKRLGFERKIGWVRAAESRSYSDWWGLYERIRTEFAGGG